MSGTRTGRTRVSVDLDEPTRALRLNRMARELRMMGQILSDDLEAVNVVIDHTAPGSTSQDGTTITLDYNKCGAPWTREAVAVWIGTFAHEVGHSKFTPRATSRLMRRINSGQATTHRGIHKVWNICEDARQERLLLGQFGAWKGYLTAMFAKHFDVANPATFPLIVGRTWLPQQVREMSGAMFTSALVANGFDPADAEQVRADVARLIGVYQRLGDPGEMDSDVAWIAVEQLYRLLGDPSVPSPDTSCGHEPMTGGWPEDGDDAQDQAEAEGIAVADDEPEPDDDEGDDDESGDPLVATNDDGDDESDEDEGDDGSDDGDDDDDDSAGESDPDEGDESEGDDDDEGDDGDGGEGEGEQHAPDPSDVRDAMRNGVREMLAEPEVADDLDRVEDALDNGGVGQGSDAPPSKGEWVLAEDDALFLERDVTEALMDLREAAEPGWFRRVGTGKLSVRRWLTDPNWTPEDIFDRFDPGQLDCCALEVILVSDVSGSMNSQVSKLGMAVWAIRRAVDALEGKCHSITFADGWCVMPGSDERPDGRVFTPKADGGTRPTGALREAARLVMESEAMHRLVIVLTDGQWYLDEKHAQAMELIREHHGTTVFVGLGVHDVTYPTQLGFDHVAKITEATEIAPLFRDVAFKLMAEAMNA